MGEITSAGNYINNENFLLAVINALTLNYQMQF